MSGASRAAQRPGIARPLAARATAGFALLSLAATPAGAHPVETGLGPFFDGIAHLAVTPPDVLIVIGLALLAGLGEPAAGRSLAPVLSCAWLAGGLLGAAFPAGGELAWATTLSFCLVGALVALNVRLPRAWLAGLACAAGVLHGYAGGATMAPERGWQFALLGASGTAFVVAALVRALVVRLRAAWARIAVRVAGSWIAAVGFLMLGWLARRRQ